MVPTPEKEKSFLAFLEEQIQVWPLAANNYAGLKHVKEKSFDINGCNIRVQCNPERILSSAAKVDAGSIAARKCFLCAENRPPEQSWKELPGSFILLVNPFPIFPVHFTVPSTLHTPQRLSAELESLFSIARQMQGFTLFYNGPECGASAPDHLHYQAIQCGHLPVEEEFGRLREDADKCILQSGNLKIWAFDNYLRKMISIETGSVAEGVKAIQNLIQCFAVLQPDKPEPMINLLCSYREGIFVVHFFPRKLHRPTQYFAEGDEKIVISPASVDFGGVFVLPRLEDFEKITGSEIEDIFAQVTLDDLAFNRLLTTFINSRSND